MKKPSIEAQQDFMEWVHAIIEDVSGRAIDARYWYSEGEIDEDEFHKQISDSRKDGVSDLRKVAIWKLGVPLP